MDQSKDPLKSSASLPVARDSEEWGAIESFLQLTYRISNVSLRGLWSVSNPTALARFERRSKDMAAIVPTVISADEIGESLRLQDICESGYPASAVGIRIHIGNLPLPSGFMDAGSDGVRKQGRGRRVFETLILRAAIGKAYLVYDVSAAGEGVIDDLSKEYDSILVKPSDPETHALKVTSASPSVVTESFLPPHAFCQTYILRDGSQLLPMFVCRFEIDTDKDEPLSLAPCQSCEQNAATIWCAADSAALCPECDESHHSVNHLTQRHIRVPINERPRPPGPCSIFADKQAELWSETLGLAISSEAQKEHFPKTVFEDIKDAYRSSVRIARRENEDLEMFKTALLSHIKAQDEAIESMDRMVKDADESCYRKVSDVLKRALSITEKRTAALLDDERRLQRKIQFAHWAEDLLTPYAHLVPPAEWLDLWLQHYRMSREVLLAKDEISREQVDPPLGAEIRIRGNLQVKDTDNPVRASS